MQRKRCNIQLHRARNKKWNCIDQLRGRMDNDHDHDHDHDQDQDQDQDKDKDNTHSGWIQHVPDIWPCGRE